MRETTKPAAAAAWREEKRGGKHHLFLFLLSPFFPSPSRRTQKTHKHSSETMIVLRPDMTEEER